MPLRNDVINQKVMKQGCVHCLLVDCFLIKTHLIIIKWSFSIVDGKIPPYYFVRAYISRSGTVYSFQTASLNFQFSVRSGPRKTFPITVQASEVGINSKATATECANAVRDNVEPYLLKFGAILYRGFPLDGPEDFSVFHSGLGSYIPLGYVGGAAKRDKVLCFFTMYNFVSKMNKIPSLK